MIGATSKRALRDAVLAARRTLPPAERLTLSSRIAERLVALEAFVDARCIALYAAMGAEVDTRPLARAAASAGKTVAFPRMSASARTLSFAVCSLDDLVPGAFGTREPPAGAALVPAGALDLVVVPGVAFDVGCYRLGRGRGYYDATLSSAGFDAVWIGVAFDLQVVAEVPREAHDAPVDAVVTESRVLFRLPGVPAGGRSSR